MTREEEIKNKADELTLYLEGYIGTSPHSREAISEYFIEMAKWADEHPRKGLVDIEKALNWLKEQKEMVGVSFQDDFYERFKKAMEE